MLMNMQRAKDKATNAGHEIARKSRKPRTQVDVSIVLLVGLTVLAALPYQLGEVATVIPPTWKPVIALVGVISATTLGVIRPYLPSPNAPEPPEKQ